MEKICISDNWTFEENLTYWWIGGDEKKQVDLPHDYAISRPRDPKSPGGFNTGYCHGGMAKYSKFIKFEKEQHTILDIDGAYMCAEIYLNKDKLAIHPNGYMPFLVDLTGHIVWGYNNKIQIVTNDMQPSSRWYSGAGIYRDVYLWTGGCVRIEPWDMYVVTDHANESEATITVKANVASDINTQSQLNITITDKHGNVIASCIEQIDVTKNKKTSVDIPISIYNPLLWDTEIPNLYTIYAEISVDGEITDTFKQNFGIREIKLSAKSGMTLNGKPIKLRGGCIHHDHGGLGTCSYPAAEERKIKNLKAAGFNSLRMSHNPQSTTFLEICDREGILIMDEAFDMWRNGKGANDYHLWFEGWWARDISYMVMRDRRHPCVISYSIGNEIHEANCRSHGDIWSQKLSDEIRKYDTSRPITSAVCNNWDNWDDYESKDAPEDYKEVFFKGHKDLGNTPTILEETEWDKWTYKYMKPLDMVGYNYFYERYAYDKIKYPDRIIWGSETHAINIYHSWKSVMENSNVLGDFTWTAWDNMGEVGAGRVCWGTDKRISLICDEYPWRCCWQGDFDLAGFRRPQSYFREMVWSDDTEPRIFTTHPMHNGESYIGTGWHWYDVSDTWTFDDKYIGENVKTDVYTKADAVRFFLNGKDVGTAIPKDGIASLQIPYQKGELKAETIKGGKVVGTSVLTTTGKAEKIVIEPEKNQFCADGRDLCYFRIYITDINGNRITDAKRKIKGLAEGGELLCIFSGDPKNNDQYTSPVCHTFDGRAIAIIKTKQKGKISLTITSDGLHPATVEVSAI